MRLFQKCINCEERYLGCHDECEYYLKDKKINDKVKEKRYIENNIKYNESYYINKKNRYIKVR